MIESTAAKAPSSYEERIGTPSSPMTLDTTAGSALHVLPRVLDRLGLGALTPLAHYFTAVVLTFLPLVVVGWCGPTLMTAPSGSVKMPFFYDFPTLCMYLVSFPCLLILTVTDQQLLSRALNSVQVDGIVTIAVANGTALAKRWRGYFHRTNLAAQAVGLVAGGISVYLEFRQAITLDIGSWVAPNKQVMSNGYVFFYCNVLFAVVTTVYLFRSFLVGLLLWDIVAHAELHILPLHPDKAGGLRPIGRLGLRNQYAITLLGLNIGLAAFVSIFFLKSWILAGIMATATICYFIFGPLVFVWPLLPFHDAMRKSKAQAMSAVASGMRLKLDALRSCFQAGALSAEDEKLIDGLRKIGDLIDNLPVWPFDTVTLRQFFTAYVIPAAISGIGVLLWSGLKLILHQSLGIAG